MYSLDQGTGSLDASGSAAPLSPAVGDGVFVAVADILMTAIAPGNSVLTITADLSQVNLEGGPPNPTSQEVINWPVNVNGALPIISGDGSMGVALSGTDGEIVFGTNLGVFREFGSEWSPLVRPAYPDSRQFIELTNFGVTEVTLDEAMHLTAPDVTIYAGSGSAMYLWTWARRVRFSLTYAPTLPTVWSTRTVQDFDIADGIVIVTSSEVTPEIVIGLEGHSTFNADVNYDGNVNLGDLGIIRGNYLSDSSSSDWDPSADINGDGVIHLGDLGPLRSSVPDDPQPAAVGRRRLFPAAVPVCRTDELAQAVVDAAAYAVECPALGRGQRRHPGSGWSVSGPDQHAGQHDLDR